MSYRYLKLEDNKLLLKFTTKNMFVFQEAIGLNICQITKSENAHGCSSFEIIFIYMFATSAKLIKKKLSMHITYFFGVIIKSVKIYMKVKRSITTAKCWQFINKIVTPLVDH